MRDTIVAPIGAGPSQRGGTDRWRRADRRVAGAEHGGGSPAGLPVRPGGRRSGRAAPRRRRCRTSRHALCGCARDRV